MQRFNLRKLNYVEVKEHYKVKILNKFASLENFGDNGDYVTSVGIGKVLKRM
jgi:hypothetical protein